MSSLDTLKAMLFILAGGYICYHIYTVGPTFGNIGGLSLFIFSTIVNESKRRREKKAAAEARALAEEKALRHTSKSKKNKA